MVRRPRNCPLSRFIGATPTKAAISFRFRVPNSGNQNNRTRAVFWPMPGTAVYALLILALAFLRLKVRGWLGLLISVGVFFGFYLGIVPEGPFPGWTSSGLISLGLIFLVYFYVPVLILSSLAGRLPLLARRGRPVRQPTPEALLHPSLRISPRVPGAAKPEEDEIERGIAAIMITDIVGYSARMGSDEEGSYGLLTIHNEIIRNQVARHKGHEVKTMGDAFLVRFKSAVDAVKCAIDCQRAFARHNARQPETEQILVRIGIHVGDILITGRDVFGEGVNVAARIEPCAEPGGICISEDVHKLVRDKVEATFVSLGRKELKNISDPPELYKVDFLTS